jgi:hypothetical protein
MQLSPHAFPREQTLQQDVTPAAFVVQARAGGAELVRRMAARRGIRQKVRRIMGISEH